MKNLFNYIDYSLRSTVMSMLQGAGGEVGRFYALNIDSLYKSLYGLFELSHLNGINGSTLEEMDKNMKDKMPTHMTWDQFTGLLKIASNMAWDMPKKALIIALLVEIYSHSNLRDGGNANLEIRYPMPIITSDPNAVVNPESNSVSNAASNTETQAILVAMKEWNIDIKDTLSNMGNKIDIRFNHVESEMDGIKARVSKIEGNGSYHNSSGNWFTDLLGSVFTPVIEQAIMPKLNPILENLNTLNQKVNNINQKVNRTTPRVDNIEHASSRAPGSKTLFEQAEGLYNQAEDARSAGDLGLAQKFFNKSRQLHEADHLGLGVEDGAPSEFVPEYIQQIEGGGGTLENIAGGKQLHYYLELAEFIPLLDLVKAVWTRLIKDPLVNNELIKTGVLVVTFNVQLENHWAALGFSMKVTNSTTRKEWVAHWMEGVQNLNNSGYVANQANVVDIKITPIKDSKTVISRLTQHPQLMPKQEH